MSNYLSTYIGIGLAAISYIMYYYLLCLGLYVFYTHVTILRTALKHTRQIGIQEGLAVHHGIQNGHVTRTDQSQTLHTTSRAYIQFLFHICRVIVPWTVLIILVQVHFASPDVVTNDVIRMVYLVLHLLSSFFPVSYLIVNPVFRKNLIDTFMTSRCYKVTSCIRNDVL